MTPGDFFGVSLGPGDPKLLTVRAVELLRSASVIFTVEGPNSLASVSRSVVDRVPGVYGHRKPLVFSMSRDPEERAAAVRRNAAAIVEDLDVGRNCVFASIGDIATYSTFGYVLREILRMRSCIRVEMVPGVTSFAALASRMRVALAEGDQELRVVPAHGEEAAARLEFPPGTTTVILKCHRNRREILRLAAREGCRVLYGERIGLEAEYTSSDPTAIDARPEEYLSLMVVSNPGARHEGL